MAIRSFTSTTAAGLALVFAIQADAGQANVSLATGSPAATATTTSVSDAATAAAASMTIEVGQTPPAAPAATPAPEPEPEAPAVTGGVNVDLFSHYVWRGFALTDGFATQPSVFVSTHGLTFTSWSSWSSTDAGCFNGDDCPALREHDFTVDFTKAAGNATFSVGYINYLFPPYRTDEAKAADAVGVTNEFYTGVTFTAPANPFVKVYFDVDGNDTTDSSRGTYMQFGVSQPIPLAEGKATLTPMFSIAYNFKQWIADNDWNDANLGVKLAIPAGHFTITPAIYLSIGLNDTVKAVGYGDGDTKFYGGIGFGYTF
jgi:hypothetical protein